jgi:NTP pyrophosphatase (non-canonical NTP hydrolase)
MNFSDYQKFTRETAVYPADIKLLYCALGLVDEAGEVAGKIKKLYRDKGGIVDEAYTKEIAKEIGDVLWYAARLLDELDVDLQDAAEMNVAKLTSRLERNKLHGDGDNR